MVPPTYDELWEECDEIEETTIGHWRHGRIMKTVWQRPSDETYWLAKYRVSTDGESNDLRDGLREPIQVMPEMVTIERREWVPIRSADEAIKDIRKANNRNAEDENNG